MPVSAQDRARMGGTGRHVYERTQGKAGPRHLTGSQALPTQRKTEKKARQTDRTLGTHQGVAGGDVAVHDVARVQVLRGKAEPAPTRGAR
jgi:hypothetical protein